MMTPHIMDAMRLLYSHAGIMPLSMTIPAVAWDALAMEAAMFERWTIRGESWDGDPPCLLMETEHGQLRIIRAATQRHSNAGDEK